MKGAAKPFSLASRWDKGTIWRVSTDKGIGGLPENRTSDIKSPRRRRYITEQCLARGSDAGLCPSGHWKLDREREKMVHVF